MPKPRNPCEHNTDYKHGDDGVECDAEIGSNDKDDDGFEDVAVGDDGVGLVRTNESWPRYLRTQ